MNKPLTQFFIKFRRDGKIVAIAPVLATGFEDAKERVARHLRERVGYSDCEMEGFDTGYPVEGPTVCWIDLEAE